MVAFAKRAVVHKITSPFGLPTETPGVSSTGRLLFYPRRVEIRFGVEKHHPEVKISEPTYTYLRWPVKQLIPLSVPKSGTYDTTLILHLAFPGMPGHDHGYHILWLFLFSMFGLNLLGHLSADVRPLKRRLITFWVAGGESRLFD